GELVAVEVGFEHVQLVFARGGPAAEASAALAADEHDLASGLGVPHPLCASARRHEERAAAELDDVDRRRVDAACRAAANLDEIVVARSEAESAQHAEEPIEELLGSTGLAKVGDGHRGTLRVSPGQRERFGEQLVRS